MDRKRGVNTENKLLYDPNQRQQRRLGAFSMEENIEDEEELEETENVDETEDIPQAEMTDEVQQEENEANQSAINQAKTVAETVAKTAVKNTAKAAGAVAKKVAGKVAMKVMAFIVANPWILAIIGVIVLLFIIIIIIGGGSISNNLSSSYLDNCSAISISTTSLSQSDFVIKVQEYFADSTDPDEIAFARNAGKIYSIAVRNGINPELVVIRAILEGFSPGASKNNYWGMGCTNTGGYDACITYDSFDDGVLGYVENISQYESVDDMMSRYAYIGSYWYNPGGSGTGGCYYFDYIKEYMTPARANEIENVCNSSNYCDTSGGPNCVATTEEDQAAYAKYQVANMAEMRKTVFGIDPDNCEVYAPGCTIFAQSDSRWGSIPLGNSSLRMSDSGCAVTSIAIGISCSGTDVTVEDFDAGDLIRALNANSCFTPGGAIYWGCSGIQDIAPSVRLVDNLHPQTATDTMNMINYYSNDNTFILLHFENSAHPRGHYVVYTSTEGNNFLVKDPAGGVISRIAASQVDQIVVYSY